MFEEATTFDQPIGNWDVSSATTFVSYDRSVGLKRSLVLLCFQVGFRVNPSLMCGFWKNTRSQPNFILFCLVENV
jgi:hypothetical protein